MEVLQLNESQFLEKTRGEAPVLVDFWAPWCTYCRRIGPAYDKLADQMGEELVFTKVNIDEEPGLAQRENIEVIPTLVLYRGGRKLGSVVAPESKAKIEEFIRQTLGK